MSLTWATRAMSSAYFSSEKSMLLQVMLFVYIENKMEDKTQPWGTPVYAM